MHVHWSVGFWMSLTERILWQSGGYHSVPFLSWWPAVTINGVECRHRILKNPHPWQFLLVASSFFLTLHEVTYMWGAHLAVIWSDGLATVDYARLGYLNSTQFPCCSWVWSAAPGPWPSRILGRVHVTVPWFFTSFVGSRRMCRLSTSPIAAIWIEVGLVLP